MTVREIPLDRLLVTKNVRFDTDGDLGELIQSTNHILLQPIGVYPRGSNRYEIVWGHRRFRAAQMNNESTIACRILDPEETPESEIPVLKLQENMVRKQLTAEEVVAAADAIKATHPGWSDGDVDKRLGKKVGYIAFSRSVIKAYGDLAAKGFDKNKLSAMNAAEVLELRARLNDDAKKRSSSGSFHRGDRVPKIGFKIIDSKGPNIVVVCSCADTKRKVLRALRALSRG
jgi:ParB-like chromosome segregation protein Spo0J